ncbi:hypothetical protein JCM10207_004914 [Rhodosporidiobolus poonsookiae]
MRVTAGQFALLAATLFSSILAAPTSPDPTLTASYSGHAPTPTTRPTPRILPLSAVEHMFTHNATSTASSSTSPTTTSVSSAARNASFASTATSATITSTPLSSSTSTFSPSRSSPSTSTLAVASRSAKEASSTATSQIVSDTSAAPSFTSTSNSSASVVARGMMDGDFELVERDLFERAPKEDEAVLKKRQASISLTCVGSTANDAFITSLFYYGGAGTVVNLCPGATIYTTNAIFFTAANQVLQTLGNPYDDTRALIVVAGSNQGCAIYGAVDGANNVVLRNVRVDGSRPALGQLLGTNALLEFGGNTYGQRIETVKAWEPRGWSVLHTAEGANFACYGMTVTGNQIGPSGLSPSWADGISHACKSSKVTNNVVTDATDGGIVLFGAPGTLVQGNSIYATSRQQLGGINMVDWTFAGSFEGVVVQGNNIVANEAYMKIGVAMGGLVWGTDNRTTARTYGGTVQDNLFLSGFTGYFGFGIAVAGHNYATVTGNTFKQANFGGVDTAACFTAYYPLPAPEAVVADPYTTPGSVFQAGFDLRQTIVYAICRGPGPITGRISRKKK